MKTRDGVPTPPPRPVVAAAVQMALMEDIAGGDLTSEATLDSQLEASAEVVAKQPLVVCGYCVFEEAFLQLDAELEVLAHVPDGRVVEAGTLLWSVQGNVRTLLAAERTALNFAQRLCGIATLARRYVRAIPVGLSCRVVDTRKTTPGLRSLERYAVRTGGAHNHRDNLGSAVLIKDNHISAVGGVATAVERARRRAPHTSKIEVEVATLAQVAEALSAGADIVMLDNFAANDVAKAVECCRGRAAVEVSGGITLERIGELARAGVDAISVGALTHSAPAADISMLLHHSKPSSRPSPER